MHEGGGGPKAELLQKMIAEEGLKSRVHMVGPVPHEKARDLLVSSSCMPGSQYGTQWNRPDIYLLLFPAHNVRVSCPLKCSLRCIPPPGDTVMRH